MRNSNLFSLAIVFLCALVLAACESTNLNETAPSFLDSHKLSDVVVSYQDAREPMHVAEIETAFRKEALASGQLSRLGDRFSSAYRKAKRDALYDGINRHIVPHIRDRVGAIFKGVRQARAIIVIRNVYVRSRFNVAALTGAEVTINGVTRPNNNQFVAGIEIVDVATGFPLQEISPISVIDDGTIQIAGPTYTQYGISKRLSDLGGEFAERMARSIRRAGPTQSGFVNESGEDEPLIQF